MGIDELDLLGWRHRVRDLACAHEQHVDRAERACHRQATEEAPSPLEQRRDGDGEGARRDDVEVVDRA
jgi:hypothetical protein